MSELTGQTVAGYPLEKPLGKGSYSSTWQATTSASPLAIKLLRDDLRTDSALNKAISYGWESTRQVLHTNLVIMYSAGVDPALGAYCLEEVVKGKSLREFILHGAKVAWRDCLILGEQLFGAIQALHKAGRCHGDIWPSNILITQDQDLKLEGSGGLTLLDRLPTDVAHGAAIGYFAPENLQGSAVTPASDLYAAGTCLYFIMSGRDAFPGDKGEVIARAVLERKAPPVSALRDDSPPEADEFIGRLMAKDPTQRYGSVDDVLADIERLKAGKGLAPLKGGKPAPAPTVKSINRPAASSQEQPRMTPRPGSTEQKRMTPRPGGGTGSVRQGGGIIATGGLSGLRAGVSGGRAGTTGAGMPAVSAGASGLSRKASSGLSPAAKSGTGIKVFGHLDTQVKSTIPQSDTEKKGDDYYRQGQLPLAVNCWREAMETAAHTALKVKIELAERDIKKESFTMALDEARHRGGIGDHRGAINRAREAMLHAESEPQRQEALKIEEIAMQDLEAAEKSRKIQMIVMGAGAVVVLIVLYLIFGGKSATPAAPTTGEHAPAAAPPVNLPGVSPAQTPSGPRLTIPGTDASILQPPNWTPSNETSAIAELVVRPAGAARSSVVMRVNRLKPGAVASTMFQELKNKPPLPGAKIQTQQEIFTWVDENQQCAELSMTYTLDAQRKGLRFFYLVNSPSSGTYSVEFDGPEELFDSALQQQMRGIMKSWTYKK